MPYYIAAMNIEHAYIERTGQYEAFEGVCFVDTLDLAEGQQLPMFAERNTERVDRERRSPINVIIGNPPYNVGQLNENDNNKNRKYKIIDTRVAETYARDSAATSVSKLNDPYVKFFRWASDRLQGRDGIVCFVSNNSFVDQVAFDGMRRHLLQDFTLIDHIDFHGNVRKNPKLSGTTHNVFGIKVGVGITLAVRCPGEKRLRYHRVPESWRREQKLAWLRSGLIEWQELTPDSNNTWLVTKNAEQFHSYLSLSDVFDVYSLGVATHRDYVVYDFDPATLAGRVRNFIETYNSEVDRFVRAGRPANVDDFVSYAALKWSRDLKQDLRREHYAAYEDTKVRAALYRPFTKKHLFFDRILNDEIYSQYRIFPRRESRNHVICLTGIGSEKPFMVLASDRIADLHLVGAGCGTQCFPWMVYNSEGTEQSENITDSALSVFGDVYKRSDLKKVDIFHYVYAILHHKAYRERFAKDFCRELPRIPFAPEFAEFATIGEALIKLHLVYEDLEPWPLEWIENSTKPLSYRMERMRLNTPRTAVRINDSLTLAGIPQEAYEYQLGSRSALEWVIDQYRVSRDERSGIVSDPNRDDDPEYIVRLVGQVVRLSVETVRLVNTLPERFT